MFGKGSEGALFTWSRRIAIHFAKGWERMTEMVQKTAAACTF